MTLVNAVDDLARFRGAPAAIYITSRRFDGSPPPDLEICLLNPALYGALASLITTLGIVLAFVTTDSEIGTLARACRPRRMILWIRQPP